MDLNNQFRMQQAVAFLTCQVGLNALKITSKSVFSGPEITQNDHIS